MSAHVMPEVRDQRVATIAYSCLQLDASGFGRSYAALRYVPCRRDVGCADTGRPIGLPPVMLMQRCCPGSVGHTGPRVLIETGGVAHLVRRSCKPKALAVRV